MKLAVLILALGTTVGCATDDVDDPSIGAVDQPSNLRFTGDESNGTLEARYARSTMRVSKLDDVVQLSCSPEGDDFSGCADGYRATLDAAVANQLLGNAEGANLAACWVTLDHCVMGGAYCTSRGCTFDQAGDNCTDLYYRYCKAWGY